MRSTLILCIESIWQYYVREVRRLSMLRGYAFMLIQSTYSGFNIACC